VKDAHVKSEAELEEAKKALEAANKFSQEADLAIRSVAFSPDGKLLATGGEFSSVHTWDAETGTAVAAFSGHSDALGAVAFLDDGALVSGSSDQSVRVWDLNPAWVLERAIGAVDQPQLISHRVTSLDFTSEADRLLVAGGVPSRSGELLVFDVADGSLQLFLPQAHDDVVYSARFSPDGKRIASASADKYIRTFDVASSQQHRRLEGHTNYVLGLAWKGDGSTLVSASADNTIKVWNPETGDQERTIPNFGKHVTAVRYIGETDNIVSSCGDRLVRMHTATNGGNFRNLGGATGWLHCVDITPDSNLVVAGTSDGKLFLWNGNNGQTLKTLAVGE
jgi:WD40 repeat protein